LDQDSQFGMISRMLDVVLDEAPPDWHELMINFYVENGHTAFVNSVVVDKEGGGLMEDSLPAMFELVELMGELRQHLAQGGRPEFTQCRLHVKADGRYEASYGHDAVDWNALIEPEWNFPEVLCKN
jgi:hypothetical protein